MPVHSLHNLSGPRRNTLIAHARTKIKQIVWVRVGMLKNWDPCPDPTRHLSMLCSQQRERTVEFHRFSMAKTSLCFVGCGRSRWHTVRGLFGAPRTESPRPHHCHPTANPVYFDRRSWEQRVAGMVLSSRILRPLRLPCAKGRRSHVPALFALYPLPPHGSRGGFQSIAISKRFYCSTLVARRQPFKDQHLDHPPLPHP